MDHHIYGMDYVYVKNFKFRSCSNARSDVKNDLVKKPSVKSDSSTSRRSESPIFKVWDLNNLDR